MTYTSVFSEYQSFLSELSSKNIESNYGLGYLSYALNSSDPFIFNSAVCFMIIVFTYVMSLIPFGKNWTRSSSYVDKFWAVAPSFFAAVYVVYLNSSTNDLFGSRTFYVSLLIIVWGARLTFHLYRRGFYALDYEDYRYTHLRTKINNPIIWELLNLFFISIFQVILNVSLTFPVNLLYASDKTSPSALTVLDFLFFIYLSIVVIAEAVSDQQQWDYQTEKHLYLKKKKSSSSSQPIKIEPKYEVGFNHTGLFRYSRHPNFFCDQLFWLSVAIYSIVIGKWSLPSASYDYIIGSLVMIYIFVRSTNLTERLSASKYPKYAEYQKKTSKVIPWFSEKVSYKFD
ncbi:hypothetical protein AYI68_g5260 [Smittium mucronatum]|uniref:Uncharacterized protein n=1 Tax=Smittium mucronatum TaxID=133383 RepID=A0A1R0GUU0_9FUNG|nr:hypothetical protein AYI68_g5260 [Smittium mucronatum]